jgi:uncharacterized repeat protein (TIGR03803 family)
MPAGRIIVAVPTFAFVTAAFFLGAATTAVSMPSGSIRTAKTIHAFQHPPCRPSALLLAGDGNFYGASAGGTFGFLFRVTSSGLFSIVHDFIDEGAGNPISLTLGKDGNLYGILSSNGAIFKYSLSGTLAVLCNLGSAVRPARLLQGSDGNLYGTTELGGTAGQGSVFRLTPAGQFTTIYSFTNGSGGSKPNELIEGSPGVFYGNCYGSPPSFSRDALFKVTLSGDFKIIRNLKDTKGRSAAHLVYATDGNLYGSYYHLTETSLFRLTPNGDVTPLGGFGFASVNALIQGGDGNLYFSTRSNGAFSAGTISRVTLNGEVTTLYSFTGKDDGNRPDAIIYVSGRGLFGVTGEGSASDLGTIFHLDTSGQLTTLARFGTRIAGFAPNNALLQTSDGSFFGATSLGGSGFYGTIYRLKSSGELTALHDFGGDTGAYPSLLIMAGDGRLYGASSGLEGKGSVYRIDPTGAFTLLHQFTDGDDGSYPTALVASRDGNIYGVATSSRKSGKHGSFFRVTPTGTFNVVKAFDHSPGDVYPVGLVEAKDGNLYGLVSYPDKGTLFRITPEGLTIDLHTFPQGAPGTAPRNLVAGADGNLYGSTHGHLVATKVVADGTVFQCTPGGVCKTLHSFNAMDSTWEPGSLLAASDGNLYGLVGEIIPGGYAAASNTIVYRLTPDGAFTPLYKVSQSRPLLNTLVEGRDGNIYGTTPNFTGPSNGGTLFQFIYGNPSAVNMSTRMKIGTGENVAIGGFIITGITARKVMLRGMGPSLAVNGQPVSGKLDNPMLELHAASGAIIGRNDDWRTTQPGGVVVGEQSDEMKVSGLAPTDDREAAIIATLPPGSYTAILSGSQNTTGLGLIELYDLAPAAGTSSQLSNLSTRGFVDTGDNLLIGGFIIDGSFYTRAKVVVRAIGPSLSQFGIPNLLQDPSLSVYDQNGNRQGANDDWRDGNQPEIVSLGLSPQDNRESALFLTLPGGSYTAVVTGEDGTTGVALVETYNIQESSPRSQ